MQETCTAPCLDQIKSTRTKREIRHMKYQNIKGWIMAFAAAASRGPGGEGQCWRLCKVPRCSDILQGHWQRHLGAASLQHRKRCFCSAPPSWRWTPLAEFVPGVCSWPGGAISVSVVITPLYQRAEHSSAHPSCPCLGTLGDTNTGCCPCPCQPWSCAVWNASSPPSLPPLIAPECREDILTAWIHKGRRQNALLSSSIAVNKSHHIWSLVSRPKPQRVNPCRFTELGCSHV